ncbi:MAG: NAD-dependent deacylase [Halofilum sp. (in: g-proteobacteria)]|nr:NAD-dependent deacylase [Halofilum sp. (in: g-proteobacteria)]
MTDQRDIDADPITALAAALEAAGTVTVLSGSGLSADSGVPTFRDAGTGLWANHRPEDVATPEAFERDPAFVWQWYRERRRMATMVEPNAGHRALAELERCLPDLRLVTQNVDGLHQRTGHRDVIEFHGNLHQNRCHREGRRVDVDAEADEPPTCPRCGGPVRPAVVWFGEMIPPAALERAGAAAEACDLFIAVGTSAEVHPAAGLADIARRHGARIAEINTGNTTLGADVDLRITSRAAEALPRVLAALTSA